MENILPENAGDLVGRRVVACRAFTYGTTRLISGQVFVLGDEKNNVKLWNNHFIGPLSPRAKVMKCGEKGCDCETLADSMPLHVRAAHETPPSLSSAEEEAQRRAFFVRQAEQESEDFRIAAAHPREWNAVQERRRALAAAVQQVGPSLANQRNQEHLDEEYKRGQREAEERARRVDELVAERYGLTEEKGGI